jgi:hypothetical protein
VQETQIEGIEMKENLFKEFRMGLNNSLKTELSRRNSVDQ